MVDALGLKNEASVKKWLRKHHIPRCPVGSHWWVAGEDLRKRMKEIGGTDPEEPEDD